MEYKVKPLELKTKIYNDKCKITIIEYDSTRKEFMLESERQVEYATGRRSYVGDYGSQECYEDDYETVKHSFEITLDNFLDEFDDIGSAVDYLCVKLDTLEDVNNFLNFLYDNCTCWEAIDERLDELAQEDFEEKI